MGKKYLDTKENSLESSVFNILHGIQEEVTVEASGDKEAYKKFFDKALKKFKIDSPADLKGDEAKKKFYDYIDKNWKADHEEEVKVDEAADIDGRLKSYREHRKKLEVARQKRMEIKSESSFIEGVMGKLDEYTSGYDKAHPVASLNAGKSSTGYELYHKTFSGAMQHAYAFAKKKGYTVDSNDIDSKVASGPKKPSSGKTNKYILGTNKKQNVHIQVTNLDNKRYELNMYID